MPGGMGFQAGLRYDTETLTISVNTDQDKEVVIA
jgi:hypothetical protein